MITTIKEILQKPEAFLDSDITLKGWVRSTRDSKEVVFIELNDGSAFTNFQIVAANNLSNRKELEKLTIGSSIEVGGKILASQGIEQNYELQAEYVAVIGLSDISNPLQKKRHSFEFLRTIAHLRSRTNTFSAVFRVRSLVAKAIHDFFQERNFVYIHTPIITGIDAEGAGEMFRVSTLPLGEHNVAKELLGKESFLTVSGQLALESFCMSHRNVYTFGPTFRAENSNTARHAAEFWMIEPEMAFADLNMDMQVAEALIKHIVNFLLAEAKDEMEFFNKYIDGDLLERLNNLAKSDFGVITYTEAINILQSADISFENEVVWGAELNTEHEKYLAESVFKKPVFVTDYPKSCKAFYMRLNDDGKTVRAMDLLVPGVGEIIGGSQREERLDVLKQSMLDNKIDLEVYNWYLDSRRFGTFPHAGFGLGFERIIMYLTGMKNIRDVVPFPRTPNNILY